MENNPAATKMFFNAAQVGELNLLKRKHWDFSFLLFCISTRSFKWIWNSNTKDGEGRRAVHFAASGVSVEVLKYLIQEMGVDIEVRDGRGETPLSLAAIKGRLAAVEYLLEIGASPEMVDDFNCSPLHHAAVKGHNNVIPLLLSKGINVDITNDFGSPLQYAATAGKHNTVKLLLDHGANPNLVFHDTFTPLHASIHSQSWQCVELLLKVEIFFHILLLTSI
ncbi:hypothetical protein MKX03_011538 [Papaver bracteatum]|nr:hypothetical protein MKX03_011538 [Papaver bracteatum]